MLLGGYAENAAYRNVAYKIGQCLHMRSILEIIAAGVGGGLNINARAIKEKKHFPCTFILCTMSDLKLQGALLLKKR